jgi:FkbM family methyltransferase
MISQKYESEAHGIIRRGGYMVCTSATPITKDTIVYSFGVGDNVQFDLSLIEKYGVSVFAFDPTPLSIKWVKKQSLPKSFRFFPMGIYDIDSTIKFYPPARRNFTSYSFAERDYIKGKLEVVELPVKRLVNIMGMLKHDTIDILKMDIEGAEYAVLDDMIRCGIRPSQILLEFHTKRSLLSEAERRTRYSINGFCKKLKRYGYEIFWHSPTKRDWGFVRKETNDVNYQS